MRLKTPADLRINSIAGDLHFNAIISIGFKNTEYLRFIGADKLARLLSKPIHLSIIQASSFLTRFHHIGALYASRHLPLQLLKFCAIIGLANICRDLAKYGIGVHPINKSIAIASAESYDTLFVRPLYPAEFFPRSESITIASLPKLRRSAAEYGAPCPIIYINTRKQRNGMCGAL